METHTGYSFIENKDANYSGIDKADGRRKAIVSDKYAKAVAKRLNDPESMAIYKQKASAASAEHVRRKKEHVAERGIQYKRGVVF
jgi:hypothetical protein